MSVNGAGVPEGLRQTERKQNITFNAKKARRNGGLFPYVYTANAAHSLSWAAQTACSVCVKA